MPSRKHIVALSGGKDSTALAFWLRENEPRDYIYVCTPTGDEFPEMFAHWRGLGRLLGTPIVPVVGGTLNQIIKEEKALPNRRMRFCTRRLKIEPYKAWLINHMPAVSYVGLRADEEEREGADYGGDVQLSAPGGVTQRYPFREIGWGLEEVWEFLRNIPGHTSETMTDDIPVRTDCRKCFFQRIWEWFVLWRDHPEVFAEAEQDEDRYGHTYRSLKVEDGEPVMKADLFGSWKVSWRDSWPADLKGMRQRFERGDRPRKAHARVGMCRVCTL